MAIGNGIRSDVWRQFLDRFGNIKMCELYGATEGSISFMNHTGKIGSVGRTNFFYKVSTLFSQRKHVDICSLLTLDSVPINYGKHCHYFLN